MAKNRITIADFQDFSFLIDNPIIKGIHEVIEHLSWRYRQDREELFGEDVYDIIRYDSTFHISPKEQQIIINAIYDALATIYGNNKNNEQIFHAKNIFKYFVDDYADALKDLNLDKNIKD